MHFADAFHSKLLSLQRKVHSKIKVFTFTHPHFIPSLHDFLLQNTKEDN